MEIQTETVENATVLKLTGRLDASSSRNVKEIVKELSKSGDCNLVFDMSGIDFIDSTGLGSLVAALRSVDKKGGEIKIAGLRERVRIVFELTRLHRIFDIFDAAEDAAGSYSRG
jgi:anti-sigma B factor antagonist